MIGFLAIWVPPTPADAPPALETVDFDFALLIVSPPVALEPVPGGSSKKLDPGGNSPICAPKTKMEPTPAT